MLVSELHLDGVSARDGDGWRGAPTCDVANQSWRSHAASSALEILRRHPSPTVWWELQDGAKGAAYGFVAAP